MLDELANKYQRDSAGHQEKIRQMEDEREVEIRDLQEKLNSEHVSNIVCIMEHTILLFVNF